MQSLTSPDVWLIMQMLGPTETLRVASELPVLEEAFRAAYKEMVLCNPNRSPCVPPRYHPCKTDLEFCNEPGYCKYCWQELLPGTAFEVMTHASNRSGWFPFYTDTLCFACVSEGSLETMMHARNV